ncbi:VTC4 phosphatase, partial [Acromyrmex heyeri]
ILPRYVIRKLVKETGYFRFELTKMSTQKELYYCYDFILDFTIKSEKMIRDAFQGSKSIETKSIYVIDENSSNCLPEFTNAITWIIDLIDGTTNFVHSFIKSSSSIELEHSSLCLKILYATIKNIHDIILRRLKAFVSITQIRIPWDAAAGIFIIKEVGGIVIDTNSGEFNVMSSKLLTVANCKLAKELIKLIKHIGKILKCGEDEKVIYNKNEGDFVTNYNQQIEKLFIDSLSKEFPNHRIIAEETVFAMQKMPELTDAPTWFLDPIDGTINFMHSLPYFNISIALMIRKVLVLGIIYNPLNSEFYTATKGKSAFLNGKPIHVSNITVINAKLMITAKLIIIIIFTGSTYDIMKANTIAAANKSLAREISKIIIDTDLTQRKRI